MCATVKLQGCGVCLTLDSRGNIISFVSLEEGALSIENRESETQLETFGFELIDDKYESSRWMDLSAAASLYEIGQNSVVFEGALSSGLTWQLTYALESKMQVRMQMRIENHGGHIVNTLRFPHLVGLASSTGEACFTLPHGAGWEIDSGKFGFDERIHLNYPVYGSMQWIDLFNEDSGFYMGVHDDVPYLKILEVGRYDDELGMSVLFTDLNLRAGEVFETPPVYIALHQGDWHAGARIYRKWAEERLVKPSVPDWYLETPSWVWQGMKGQYADRPDQLFSDLPEKSIRYAKYGIDTLQVASYMEHGHDTRYPDYYAGESIGGEQGLVGAVNEIHRNSRRLTIYTNGRLTDPESSLQNIDDWTTWCVQSMGPEHAKIVEDMHMLVGWSNQGETEWDPAGVCMKEEYGFKHAIMCPGSLDWRELFTSRLEYLAREYRVDGIYIDQVCGSWGLPCYSTGHQHERPNEAWSGYREMLSNLRKRIRDINTDTYLATEGVNDFIGQYFDILQGHNDWKRGLHDAAEMLTELFRYTLPWYVVNMGPIGADDFYYLRIAHLAGSGFDFIFSVSDQLSDEFRAELAAALKWRKEFSDVFFKGEVLKGPETNTKNFRTLAFCDREKLIVTCAWLSPVDTEYPDRIVLDFSSLPLTELTYDSMQVLSPQGSVDFKFCEGMLTSGKIAIEVEFHPMLLCCMEL